MNPFANIFDAELVQLKTRRQVLNLTATIVVTIVGTAILLYLAPTNSYLHPVLVGICVLSSLVATIWMLDRIQRARWITWCLKLSDDAVVGYDFSRQRHVIRWTDVEAVDVTDRALYVRSRRGTTLVVPHLFREYGRLGHCLLDYAEQNGVPTTLNGKSLKDIDVYTLFPDLTGFSSAA